MRIKVDAHNTSVTFIQNTNKTMKRLTKKCQKKQKWI